MVILESFLDNNIDYNISLIEKYEYNLNESIDIKAGIKKIKDALLKAIQIVINKFKSLIKWIKSKFGKKGNIKNDRLEGHIKDYEYKPDALKKIDALINTNTQISRYYNKIVSMVLNNENEVKIKVCIYDLKDSIDDSIKKDSDILKSKEEVDIDLSKNSDFYNKLYIDYRTEKLMNIIEDLETIKSIINKSKDPKLLKYQSELMKYILKFHNTLSSIFNIICATNNKIYFKLFNINDGEDFSKEEFEKAVKSNDILQTKMFIINSMKNPFLLSPNSLYNRRLRFALKNISHDEFYDNSKENIEREKEDGFYKDKSQWTKDYLKHLLAQLPGPFNQKASKKLWDHATQVVQYVYSGSKFRNKL